MGDSTLASPLATPSPRVPCPPAPPSPSADSTAAAARPATATTAASTAATISTTPASAASSSTSLFSVKLSRELSKLPDAQWRAASIDYQRLRKQIKKIVYYEQEAKQNSKQQQAAAAATTASAEAGGAEAVQRSVDGQLVADSTAQPASSLLAALSASSAQRDRLRKSRDVFWFVLKAEIEKVNGFFAGKEAEANRQFAAVGLESELSAHSGDSDGGPSGRQAESLSTDRLVFAKLLLEQHPRALAERLLPPPLLHSASSVAWAALPSARVALLSSFLQLCGMLDQLRKFVVVNYVVGLKVLRKYDDFTVRGAKDELSRELSDEPFAASARLATLLQRAEHITFRLLPPAGTGAANGTSSNQTDMAASATATALGSSELSAHSSSSPAPPSASAAASSSACPICHLSLANPVQLQCGHRCCFNCLASHTVARSFSCPVCAAVQEFDSLDLGLESVLSKFAGVSLTDRERMEGDKQAAEHSQRRAAQGAEQQQQQQQQHHSVFQADGGLSVLPRVKTESAELGEAAMEGGSSVAAAAAALHSSLLPLDAQQFAARLAAGVGVSLGLKLLPDSLLLAKDEADMDESSSSDDDSDGSPSDGSVHPSRHKHGSLSLDGSLLGSEHRKLGRGSCHQCKTTRESKMLLCCTSKAEKGKRKRKCRKKYCAAWSAHTRSSNTPQPTHDTRASPPLLHADR